MTGPPGRFGVPFAAAWRSLLFHRPDRSDYIPVLEKTPENDPVDVGWFEGRFVDGRPYRAEHWEQEQLSVTTVFFSMEGLEHLAQPELKELLANEGLFEFVGAGTVAGSQYTDAGGHLVWSVSVILAERGKVHARERFKLLPYTCS